MSLYFTGEEQSLQDILEAREKRVKIQQYLINKYKGAVVSYKLNIPGPVKYNSFIKRIFDEGLKVFKRDLKRLSVDIQYEKVLYENSGPEYFAVFKMSSNLSIYLIKRISTNIEETHALGRIFDFDIIDACGKQFSREDLGIGPRKCLLCNNNAFVCGRSRAHSIVELIEEIENMSVKYFNEQDKNI